MKTLRLLAIAVIALFSSRLGHADNAITFGASVAPGNVPKLNWSAPWATSCAASGAWGGSRSASGTATGSPITATVSYTITCTAINDTTATLNWLAPTTNTDGTPLTDLAGFNVYSGWSSSALTLLAQVKSPTTLTYQALNQPAGVAYYVVTAYNTAGVESPKSAVVSKTFSAVAVSASATITFTVPAAPTLSIK